MSLALVEIGERYSDETPTAEDREEALKRFEHMHVSLQLVRLLWGLTAPLPVAAGELRNIAGWAASRRTVRKDRKYAATRAALNAEADAQCHVIRDIFGNPFSQLRVDPAWLTPHVLSLATASYNKQRPDGRLNDAKLAALAAGLEEAGCQESSVLRHLRDGGEHWRGCCVVDAILGRG